MLDAIATEPNKIFVFLALFAGVVFHWLYEVAVGAVKTGKWEFGTTGQITGRLFISFVVSVAGLVAAYAQVKLADEGFRYVSAFTIGLSIDALTAPWTKKSTK